MLILAGLWPGVGTSSALGWLLAWALGVHVVLIVFENLLAPSPTRHHELAVAAIRRGAFARIFWGGAIACTVVSIAAAPSATIGQGGLQLAFVAVLALAGSFAWEYIWVEAGQSVPLS